jgi:hypothetical protein
VLARARRPTLEVETAEILEPAPAEAA